MRYVLDNVEHGTRSAYVKGCGCNPCTEANTAYCRNLRQARYKIGLPEGDQRHGTNNGYVNYGCGCDACTKAHTEYCYFNRHGFWRNQAPNDNDLLPEDLAA